MRRNATHLGWSVLVILALLGCRATDKNNQDAQALQGSQDLYAMSTSEPTYGPDPYARYTEPAAPEPSRESAELTTFAPAAAAPRYHTVSKSDTLYKLARTYYKDQSRWKDIYEANRSVIGDPNVIRVGQRLLIP